VAVPQFRYVVHHPVLRTKLGELEVREASWSESVNGGSTFTGKVTVPDNPSIISEIRRCTETDRAAIYVDPGLGRIQWGGVMVGRSFDDSNNTLSFTAMEWRSWLFRVVLGPRPDGTGTNTFTYTNTDQFAIARAVINRLLADGSQSAGLPSIDYGLDVTGINRNYQIGGMEFKSAGAHLDTLANLDRGFEWDLEPYYANDSLPSLRLQLYFPQRGGVLPWLVFRKKAGEGNILKMDEMDMDSSASDARVWAVGDGPNAESTPWAMDQSPEVAAGTVLRTDQVSTYSGALTRTTLASYARAERVYRADALAVLKFPVRLDSPSILDYQKGDRCRVIVNDRWNDIDVSNCRIVSRDIDPDKNIAVITVNLNDLNLPEVDTGGSV